VLTASKLITAGSGLAPVLVRRASTVELDWDTRQKSRFEALDSQGRRIGVFLARGQVVRGGDVLVAEDGSLIVVKARPQPVLTVTAGPQRSPLDLLRAAYHLGNRHVPLEVKGDRLQFEPDHVLGEMLRRMGLVVEAGDAAFEPEAGAYDAANAGHGHGHEPHNDHDHDHGHVHDAHCGHDHAAHDHAGHDHTAHGHTVKPR
jgi:urease accessory protein